jgi:hypothetical protein
MAFRLEIAPLPLEDLDRISANIRKDGSFENAKRWFNGIIDAIRSLEARPSRCRLAEESEELQAEVRFLLYGKRNRMFKIYFAIHKDADNRRGDTIAAARPGVHHPRCSA